MSGGTIAAISAYRPSLTYTGTLSKTAAPSGGIVTSDAITFTKPAASSGVFTLANFVFSGSVVTQQRKNAASFSTFSEPGGDTVATGDTFQVQGTGMTAGESWQFDLIDSTTGVKLGTYTIAAV